MANNICLGGDSCGDCSSIVARSGNGAGMTAGGVADVDSVGCDKADGVGYHSSSTPGQAEDRWKVTMPLVISYVPPLETTTDVKPGTMLSVIVTFDAR